MEAAGVCFGHPDKRPALVRNSADWNNAVRRREVKAGRGGLAAPAGVSGAIIRTAAARTRSIKGGPKGTSIAKNPAKRNPAPRLLTAARHCGRRRPADGHMSNNP